VLLLLLSLSDCCQTDSAVDTLTQSLDSLLLQVNHNNFASFIQINYQDFQFSGFSFSFLKQQ